MAPDYSHAHISTEGYRSAHPGQVNCTDVWFPIALEGRLLIALDIYTLGMFRKAVSLAMN